MIGNLQDAQLIAEWKASHGRYCANCKEEYFANGFTEGCCPEGWKFLGEGCYRTAYESPDGVVYKVEIGGWGGGQTNEQEAKNIRRLYYSCKMPKGTRLPRFEYFPECKVIAMEKVDTPLKSLEAFSPERMEYGRLTRQIARVTKSWDLHDGNLAIDSRTKELVPIDLGDCGSAEY